ncbi:hypothetical protein POTOM_015125 [Populus tomentosa]|uniref:Bet v I/Major latex protein domain-containing protein n=1 Tax=Populus tomentosa TaxID=118781 RepID=A0A8X8D597_POPTO|nr:hypothetical protein POTOM_015125 [Populus tomentosa]
MSKENHVQTKIRDGSKEKFYNFFKCTVNLITDICPNLVKSIQLADGTKTWEASPGTCKVIKFKPTSVQLNDGAIIEVKDTVTHVLDDSRTIIYEIENGGPLGDITKVKLEVTDENYARWTVYYTNTNPDGYLELLKSVNEAVDTYISTQH